MNLREKLGFKYFYIGRDHAGAENNYKPLQALKLVNKFKKNFNIKPITSMGGYYCKSCEKYLIRGSCKHKKLVNISGTEFRESLKKKIIYVHADKKLQFIISKIL
jgi:sulfate adenylyltransferase